MNCTACGALVETESAFCSECGIADPLRPPRGGGERLEVVVKDVEMAFGSMVIFVIKWAFASIPAILIFAAIGAVVGLALGAVLAWPDFR